MKNVLGVFVTMPVGGAEKLWFSMLRKLDRSRFNVVTCCIGEKGTIGELIEKEGFEIVALDRMRGKRFDLGAVIALARLINERRIDIVHTHLYHAGLYARLASLLAGKPRPKVVVMNHNVYFLPKPHRLMFARLLNRITDSIVAVSDAVRNDIIKYEKVDPGLISVLPNCCDPAVFDTRLSKDDAKARLGLRTEDFVLGNVARLVESKGQKYLIEALSVLKNRDDRYKVVIAGSGLLMEELKATAATLGVAGDVLLLGMRHDIPELYRAMDMYVMPSLWEGAPLSLIDAMGAGLPCITTTAGGMPELLDNGACGLLIPPADPGAIASAVLALSGDTERMAVYSAEARMRARSLYSSEAIARRLEEIYDRLFDAPEGKAS